MSEQKTGNAPAKGFNVIWVFSPDERQALFCLRQRPPFQGLYNLVGGKIKPDEDGLDAAYRELYEETGIRRDQITLIPLTTFQYPWEGLWLEAYAGRLRAQTPVYGEENPLAWLDVTENFFDMSRFAGVGNIGHMYALMQGYGSGFLAGEGRGREAAWHQTSSSEA